MSVRGILFIANGHGESAIAGRLARALAASAAPRHCDLFPLVGTGGGAGIASVVGPRREMPSGGLVAMGNLRAFAADLRAGFAGLFGEQLRFLAGARNRYDAIVAVGDTYALALALLVRRPVVFVGTAKSVYVAQYGPGERLLLRRAARTFVRDAATAERLRSQRVPAEAPGNVIADLVERDGPGEARARSMLGVLPGSRATAYADGVQLAAVARALGSLVAGLRVRFSVAPTLDAARFAAVLAADGWAVAAADEDPGAAYVAYADATRLELWTGSFGALLNASVAVLGQAGTGNEQAAAFGIPVIALDDERAPSGAWYRMRQRRLLGDALALVPAAPHLAAAAIAALWRDPQRLAAMGAAGRERMGAPGGAAAIARAIGEVAG